MFQVNASLAIIMSFLITFVDEVGEIKDLDMKKSVLIGISLVVGFLIYRHVSNKEAEGINSKKEVPANLIPLDNKVEQFKNFSYIN